MMTPHSISVSVNSVSKAFGRVIAVDDVSFHVSRNSFFSLLGPSGCGKTTLLRMLAGFVVPTEGEIEIDNEIVTYVPPEERPTNMVFQNYAIFPHLDVANNIAYGLRSKGYSQDKMRTMVEEALELIKMKGYARRQPQELSGGERQRVALARALVCRPKVLLLDEPLGALDKRLREEMQLELREIQQAVGITFILVTHDQEEALTMSDAVAVMFKGKILQIAPPSELYERPNCKEVASFIGKMNFFDGTVRGMEGNIVFVDCGAVGAFRARTKVPVHVNQSVSLAVRPEKIRLTIEAEPKRNSICGRLGTSSYFGDRSHLYIEHQTSSRRVVISVPNNDNSPLVFGATVWASWSPDDAVLLTQ